MRDERRTEEENQKGSDQSDPARGSAPARVKGQTSDQVNGQGQTSQEQLDHQAASREQTDAANAVETLNPPQDQQRVCQHLFEDTDRRRRRRLLGNIDLNKLFQAGTTCSPYHALVLQECKALPLPEELPTIPWAGSQSLRRGGTKLSPERENQANRR